MASKPLHTQILRKAAQTADIGQVDVLIDQIREALGFTKNRMTRLLNGKVELTTRQAVLVADVLDIPVARLLEPEPETQIQ
jgi:plasmid maintenance system antidote protein VapI